MLGSFLLVLLHIDCFFCLPRVWVLPFSILSFIMLNIIYCPLKLHERRLSGLWDFGLFVFGVVGIWFCCVGFVCGGVFWFLLAGGFCAFFVWFLFGFGFWWAIVCCCWFFWGFLLADCFFFCSLFSFGVCVLGVVGCGVCCFLFGVGGCVSVGFCVVLVVAGVVCLFGVVSGCFVFLVAFEGRWFCAVFCWVELVVLVWLVVCCFLALT